MDKAVYRIINSIKGKDDMARGAFNNTADLYYGPGSTAGTPGAKYATAVPCRLVLQDEIFQHGGPNQTSSYWITFDPTYPHVEVYTNTKQYVYTVDWSQADQIAVPSGTAPQYVASRAETIEPGHSGGTPYSRVLAVPLPFPVPPPLPPPSARLPFFAYPYEGTTSGTTAYFPVSTSAADSLVLVVAGSSAPSTPSGWTLAQSVSTTSGGVVLSVYYKISAGETSISFSGYYYVYTGVVYGLKTMHLSTNKTGHSTVQQGTAIPTLTSPWVQVFACVVASNTVINPTNAGYYFGSVSLPSAIGNLLVGFNASVSLYNPVVFYGATVTSVYYATVTLDFEA